jgi:V/A-type H+-transporting ATPase subunit F
MDSKRIIVLGDRDTVSGFKLSGVREAYVVDKENAGEIYGKIKDAPALFFITGEVEELFGSKVKELRGKTLVQVIPKGGVEYPALRQLIKEAIGFDVGAVA